MEAIQAWLKGKRDYGEGVALYVMHGEDTKLEALFLKGPTDFSRKKLAEELTKLNNPPVTPAHTELPLAQPSPIEPKNLEPPKEEIIVNPELLASADQAAKLAWKELMNMRAVLFNMCHQSASWEDENEPTKVKSRGTIALKILQDNKRIVSPAYDALHCVRTTGKMPTVEKQILKDFELLPDDQVKHTIDNTRKSISKLKTLPQTPKRVALLQKHQENLDRLLVRWETIKHGTV